MSEAQVEDEQCHTFWGDKPGTKVVGRAGVRVEMSARDVRPSEYASFPHASYDVIQQLSMSPGSQEQLFLFLLVLKPSSSLREPQRAEHGVGMGSAVLWDKPCSGAQE